MKRSLLFLWAVLTIVQVSASGKEGIKWFREAKLGMFIHWGLYSQAAGEWKGHPTRGGEHFMLYERIPLKEYALLAKDFNPVGFDAGQWVKAAKKAGMKYIVYTTKHHDGFAMYHSACSDYNIVRQTPWARDPLQELAKACRKQGIKLGLYYSLGRDWQDPDVPTNWPVKAGRSNTWDYPDEDAKDLAAYLERKVKPQLKELLTNYGEIAMLWFDTPELVTKQQSLDLLDLIHSLQPHCLVNSRIGNSLGDYAIVEQKLMDKISLRPWEACLTMGQNWGYNRFDTLYKRPDLMIRNFVDIVSKGGNLLLNIGPDGQGRFPDLTRPGLEAFQDWMDKNGEAVYKTVPWKVYGENRDGGKGEKTTDIPFHDAVYDGTPREIIPDFRYTAKDNTVYAIVRNVPENSFVLRSFQGVEGIKRVTLLENHQKVNWKITGEGLQILNIDRPEEAFPVYVLKIQLQN